MKKISIALLIIVFAQIGRTQNDYLGQTPPGNVPEIFAPGVISVENRYEYGISFSPDGKEVFYTAENPGNGLMVIRKSDGQWGEPEVANLRSNHRWEFEAFHSPDGQTLFFASNTTASGNPKLWVSEKTSIGWGTPYLLNSPVNNTDVFWATVATDGTLYYTNLSTVKIWKSELINGTYPAAQDFGLPFGIHPTIGPDETFLLFNHSGDLYVCFNQGNDHWSEPFKFGEEINTSWSETCPCISPDGEYLFFSRYNDTGDKSDIYWVSASIIRTIKNEMLGSTVTDADGNVYQTITIGDQIWMAENLRTTRYSNGDLIGTTNPATLDISSETMPKYQWAFNGAEKNVEDYGRLYTWYAVNDSRCIAPEGWHIPTDEDWTVLIDFLGGDKIAGGELKETGTSHWASPNAAATNESGFSARAGGCRTSQGPFDGALHHYGCWWSSTESTDGNAWYRNMVYHMGDIFRYDTFSTLDLTNHKKWGFSVRCIKDAPTSIGDLNQQAPIPREMRLNQNYPNPFNPTTTIHYSIKNSAKIKLEIHDSLGRLVKTLVDDHQSTGEYQINWEGTDQNNHVLPSGVYIYTLSCNELIMHRKMLLIR